MPQSRFTELSKSKIPFPSDDVVGLLEPVLFLNFKTDLRAPKDHDGLGRYFFKQVNDRPNQRSIPYVNPDTNQTGLGFQGLLDNVDGPLIDVTLQQDAIRLEGSQIGLQVAQAKRGMNEFGIDAEQKDGSVPCRMGHVRFESLCCGLNK